MFTSPAPQSPAGSAITQFVGCTAQPEDQKESLVILHQGVGGLVKKRRRDQTHTHIHLQICLHTLHFLFYGSQCNQPTGLTDVFCFGKIQATQLIFISMRLFFVDLCSLTIYYACSGYHQQVNKTALQWVCSVFFLLQRSEFISIVTTKPF